MRLVAVSGEIADQALGQDVDEEASQELAEALGFRKLLDRTVKLELGLKREVLQRSRELAAKDATENTDGREKTGRSSNPSVAIDRTAACRDDAVDVRMMLQVLFPGAQDIEQAISTPKCFGIACDFEQRCALVSAWRLKAKARGSIRDGSGGPIIRCAFRNRA